MRAHAAPRHDILRELREEVRWAEDVGKLGRCAAPARDPGLDGFLAELIAAHALRRRLEARLAEERELRELIGCVLEEEPEARPLRAA